jgi:DNA polymerase-3 subunit delta
MPDISRDELWRQLKQNFLAPAYVLFGAESYLRDLAVGQIINRSFNEGDLQDFNLDEFSLNDREAINDALAAAQQLPMMSSRRVVKIADVRVASTTARDTLKEECEEMLEKYLADPAPSTVLIMVADELNGNRKITKLLKRSASTVEFKRLEDDKLIEWIRKQFDEQGFKIDDLANRRLAQLVGSDLRRLNNEIAKLCAASLPSKAITFDLVEGLVPNTNEIENFALTAAIVSGGGKHALGVLKKILDDGAEPVQLLGLLSYNFRRLLMANEMMHRGDDRREIASILKMRYREQEDFLAAARRSDRTKLLKVFDRLARSDIAMKTSLGGGGDQGTRMQIEVLVCEISAAMGRSG